MIERERLQELIEKEETVWCASELWGGNKLKLHNKDVRDSDCFHISKTLLLSDSIEFYDEEETYRVPFQLLFETQQEYLNHKEEAEWVAKMHTQRTELFEPPIWEEFEKDPKFSFWVNKFDGLGGLYCIEKTTDMVFDECGNEVEKQYLDIYATLIENHKTGSGYFYRRDYTKDNYIKACEYARNLFLGKENENE